MAKQIGKRSEFGSTNLVTGRPVFVIGYNTWSGGDVAFLAEEM